MGQLKQKLVHAAMPRAWFSHMLNRTRRKPSTSSTQPDCKQKPSQSKKPASLQKKHSSGSTFINHKAKDIHFPSTLKKSSLKACREGSPVPKQAANYKQENSPSFDELESGPGSLRSLYRCTMSPNSRKVCAGLDVTDMPPNTHYHLNMAHQYALHGHPCHINITSRQKNFQLDLEELEMKLNALSPQGMWRNTYISPLLSVAVPSPSLDVALDYNSHPDLDSLKNSPRHSPSRIRGKCRRSTVRKPRRHGMHERTLHISNLGKTAACNKEPKNHVWPNNGDDFIPSRKHQRRVDLAAANHTGYSTRGGFEAQNRHFMRTHGHYLVRNDYSGMKYRSLHTRNNNAKKRNPASTSAYNLLVQESRQLVSKKTQKMEQDDGRSPVIDTKSENLLYHLGHSHDSEISDDHSGLASQIYRGFSLQEKHKLNAKHVKKRSCYHNSPVATTVQDECDDRSLEFFRSELMRSLSTQSTLSHNTFSSCATTSSSQDGVSYCESHQGIPSVSWMSRQGSRIINGATQHTSCRSLGVESLHPVSLNDDLVHPDHKGIDESSEANNVCYEADSTPRNSDVCKVESSGYYGVLHGHGSSCPPINIHGTPHDFMHVSSDGDENKNADDERRAMSALGSKALIDLNSYELAKIKRPLGANVWFCQGSQKSGKLSHQKRRWRTSCRKAVTDDDETMRAHRRDLSHNRDMSGHAGGGRLYGTVQGTTMWGCLGTDEYGIITTSASGYQASGESDEHCEEADSCHSSDALKDASESMIRQERASVVNDTSGSNDKVMINSAENHLQAEIMLSYNLRQDFKEAMVANIEHLSTETDQNGCTLREPEGIRGGGGGIGAGEARLLELLQCYLALNHPYHHPPIIAAFCDICQNLKQGSPF